MARPLRIQFENAYYHVTCRGNAQQAIFKSDADRTIFLDLLKRSGETYQVALFAFVLMYNHFHLLLRTPLANLQEFMRHFNISYTSSFNHRHRRAGHLYQGRYKSFLIDKDSYLFDVSRYIHLNPVRVHGFSGLPLEEKRKYLRNYRWSSYPGYYAPHLRHPFLSVDEVLDSFGGDTKRGRQRYVSFVETGLSGVLPNPFEKGKGHGIVGEAAFVERIREGFIGHATEKREVPALRRVVKHVAPEQILRLVQEKTRVPRDTFLKKGYKGAARMLAMELLYRYGGLNQREIGELMGVDYSSVSVGRKRLWALLESDATLMKQMEAMKRDLTQG